MSVCREWWSTLSASLLHVAAMLVAVHGSADRLLIKAAKDGDAVRVRQVLALPQHAPRADASNGRALLFTALHGHDEVVELLLAQGDASPAIDHFYPALEVLKAGHDAVAALLARNPNHPKWRSEWMLVQAAGHGRTSVVRDLLSGFSAPSRHLLDGPSPTPGAPEVWADCQDGAALVAAAYRGHEDTVRLLLGWHVRAPRADALNGEALVAAATKGHAAVLALLLSMESAPRADCQQSKALCVATREGHVAVVKLLLSAGEHAPRADAFEGALLVAAAANGHDDVVRLLLEWLGEGAALADSQSRKALVEAARGGHEGCVALLLRGQRPGEPNAARADAQNGEALVVASRHGRASIVSALLAAREHAPSADVREGAALAQAALNGHTDVLRLLLSAPRNAARADANDSDALLGACQQGHERAARLLLGWRAHPARAGARDGRALRAAAALGRAGCVAALCEQPERAHGLSNARIEAELLDAAQGSGMGRADVEAALTAALERRGCGPAATMASELQVRMCLQSRDASPRSSPRKAAAGRRPEFGRRAGGDDRDTRRTDQGRDEDGDQDRDRA
ncbi:hypothetical protein FOA52_006440 [Chlamydomonas sp. UWO 241]|nr:hypothetical protein FOA52_006440 [Chlamydomonas sp. UWO 241]